MSGKYTKEQLKIIRDLQESSRQTKDDLNRKDNRDTEERRIDRERSKDRKSSY